MLAPQTSTSHILSTSISTLLPSTGINNPSKMYKTLSTDNSYPKWTSTVQIDSQEYNSLKEWWHNKKISLCFQLLTLKKVWLKAKMTPTTLSTAPKDIQLLHPNSLRRLQSFVKRNTLTTVSCKPHHFGQILFPLVKISPRFQDLREMICLIIWLKPESTKNSLHQFTFPSLKKNLECTLYFVYGKEGFSRLRKELPTLFGLNCTEKSKSCNWLSKPSRQKWSQWNALSHKSVKK